MCKQTARVSVIIVSYNSKNCIGNALDVLSPLVNENYIQCFVVDNNSNDRTVEYINCEYPFVIVIENRKNFGFGHACNIAAKKVQTDYMLIHNPDASIDPNHIKELVRFADHNKKVGIVGPAIIEGTSIQSAGLMTTPLTILRSELGYKNSFRHQRKIVPGGKPFKTSWVCGAMMLIGTNFFRQIGGFDPHFFLYFEETDLCRRFLNSGVEIWALGNAIAYHKGGESAEISGKTLVSKCIEEYYFQSRFYYLSKHFTKIIAIWIEFQIYVIQLIKYSVNSLLRKKKKEKPIPHLLYIRERK